MAKFQYTHGPSQLQIEYRQARIQAEMNRIAAVRAKHLATARAKIQAEQAGKPDFWDRIIARIDANPSRFPSVKTQPTAKAAASPTAYRLNTSATEEWKQAVQRYVDQGMTKAKAVQKVNETHPGLREQMLEEKNAGRRRP